MHLKRCYIFRVYSRGREVHGWIVPYHMQICVSVKSTYYHILFYWCCICPRLCSKKYSVCVKKKSECVCVKCIYKYVCVCVSVSSVHMRGWVHAHVCERGYMFWCVSYIYPFAKYHNMNIKTCCFFLFGNLCHYKCLRTVQCVLVYFRHCLVNWHCCFIPLCLH